MFVYGLKNKRLYKQCKHKVNQTESKKKVKIKIRGPIPVRNLLSRYSRELKNVVRRGTSGNY